MKATLMHLTQCVNSRVPQKLEDQPRPLYRCGTLKSRQTNDQHHQRTEDSVSASTKKNEVTSGQRALVSQRSSENLKALRYLHKGKNSKAKQTQPMGGIPMAVRTKWMGVNPETEVARSHTLTSKGVNARAGSTYPNQDARNNSGNVFWRLGRGADLKDTLIRRCDQERSQQSAAQNRQLVAALGRAWEGFQLKI